MAEPDDRLTEELPEFPAAVEPVDSFVDESHLTYLIPSETDIDLEVALSNHDKSRPILESIPQREALFFDETVDVLLVLKTPWLPKKELDSHINRLVISLEAHIINGTVPGRDSLSSESIFSGRLQEIADPFIVVEEQDSSDAEEDTVQNVYAMWKFPVLLNRPRMRLHSPSVVFSASAALRSESGGGEINSPPPPGTGYLPSGLPSGFNLLESFSSDPSLNGIKPRLSALRVSRVSPVTRQQDLMTRLRALPQLSLRIFPILHTRIRFCRSTTIPPSPSLIALLEIDFTPHFDCKAILDEIKLSTNEGTIEDLNEEAGLNLPLTCVSHDHITFLYLIKPYSSEASSTMETSGTLDISVSTTVNVKPTVCTPRLAMTWSTALDFSHADAAALSSPATKGSSQSSLPPSSSSRPDALPALEASSSSTANRTGTGAALSDLGITMSFTAPPGPIHPGDIFSWTVYVVNRATEKTARPPRKLAFVAVPKRRRSDTRLPRPPSTSVPRPGERDIADAVMDENVLHALQKSAAVEATDLICLSTDTRVGPVAPGACHVVELQFLALREGILGLEAIRVVDLNSQEHVDIRDLPTTIVTPAAAAATTSE